jgi:predicted Rossmann fold nucleotide-binding protein DprA/Smf involved in DNA uptake
VLWIGGDGGLLWRHAIGLNDIQPRCLEPEAGIELLSAVDDRFAASLRERLRSACPTFLLVAGPIDWLSRPGLGIVGSRDAS